MPPLHAHILLCIHLQQPISASMADEDYSEAIYYLESEQYIHRQSNWINGYTTTDKGEVFVSLIALIT